MPLGEGWGGAVKLLWSVASCYYICSLVKEAILSLLPMVCFTFEKGSCYVTQADCELEFLLPQPLRCWVYRCVLPNLAIVHCWFSFSLETKFHVAQGGLELQILLNYLLCCKSSIIYFLTGF